MIPVATIRCRACSSPMAVKICHPFSCLWTPVHVFAGVEPKAFVHVGPAMSHGLTLLQHNVVDLPLGQGMGCGEARGSRTNHRDNG